MKRADDFPKILMFRGHADMRKQAIGLADVVQQVMKENPFNDCLFLFCNRRRDIIKALYFDRAGFCLWTKRLDQNRFPWLKESDDSNFEISAEDLNLLLDGVDVFKRHKKLSFSSVS